jgi:hypothetical protein
VADNHDELLNSIAIRVALGLIARDVKSASSLDAIERFIVAEGYMGVKLTPGRISMIIGPSVGRKLHDKQGDPR